MRSLLLTLCATAALHGCASRPPVVKEALSCPEPQVVPFDCLSRFPCSTDPKADFPDYPSLEDGAYVCAGYVECAEAYHKED